MSAAIGFKPRVSVVMGDQTVTGLKQMKILGVRIDCDYSIRSHISDIGRRMRSKSWALAKLKKAGLSSERLVRAYKGFIRPLAEYASPAWHPLATAEQAAFLERQQCQALRNIYGFGTSAEKMRQLAEIPPLSRRRLDACLKFAQKNLDNPRCMGWFKERRRPLYARRLSASYPKYEEPIARTDRYRNSPKNFLIRLLNQQ